MKLPIEIEIFGIGAPVHYPLELLSYFIGFQLYLLLKKQQKDDYGDENRMIVLLGGVLGAALGSKILGFLEHPEFWKSALQYPFLFMASKTILGGLVGGLIGVEIAKAVKGIKRSSGDLYVYPIIIGMSIGRIGCFLQGVSDGTWGNQTDSIFGMDGGDGIMRHPAPLYEIFALLFIALIIKIFPKTKLREGDRFKIFLGLYCLFRLGIENLKPVVKYLPLQLSMIQLVSLAVIIFYCVHFVLRGKNLGSS